LFGWQSGFERKDLSVLCVDGKIVWINGYMIRFEGIWREWLWKFGNNL